MQSLENKICIVTGGAGGIGFAIANHLLAKKAIVIILDKDLDKLNSLSKHSNLYTYKCDVTNESEIEKTILEISNKFEKIDVLVNNVGILYSAPLISLGTSGIQKHDSLDWEKVIATNLSSAFYTSKHVVEVMLKKRIKGVIVNISSVSAKGNAGQSAYSAAKAGLEALTKVWSKELALIGIRCFAVAPGFCDTESTRAAIGKEMLDETIRRVPLRRLGKVDEIAELTLSGIQNDFFNGKIIEIDGGLVI
jgi:3-oxoacyl-[acyl-carrier protein] reductase